MSEWINPDADDARLKADSVAALRQELAWAGHLGLQAVMLPPVKQPLRSAHYSQVVHQVRSWGAGLEIWGLGGLEGWGSGELGQFSPRCFIKAPKLPVPKLVRPSSLAAHCAALRSCFYCCIIYAACRPAPPLPATLPFCSPALRQPCCFHSPHLHRISIATGWRLQGRGSTWDGWQGRGGDAGCELRV